MNDEAVSSPSWKFCCALGKIIFLAGGMIVVATAIIAISEWATRAPIGGRTFYDAPPKSHTTIEYLVQNQGFGNLEEVSLIIDVPAYFQQSEDEALDAPKKLNPPIYIDDCLSPESQIAIDCDLGVNTDMTVEPIKNLEGRCKLIFSIVHSDGQTPVLKNGGEIRVRMRAPKRKWQPSLVEIRQNGVNAIPIKWDQPIPAPIRVKPSLYQGVIFTAAILIFPIYNYFFLNPAHAQDVSALKQEINTQKDEHNAALTECHQKAYSEGYSEGYAVSLNDMRDAEKEKLTPDDLKNIKKILQKTLGDSKKKKR